jgi:hypothetical protein
MKASRIVGISKAFETLAAVKIGDAVYRGAQFAGVRKKLEDALRPIARSRWPASATSSARRGSTRFRRSSGSTPPALQ